MLVSCASSAQAHKSSRLEKLIPILIILDFLPYLVSTILEIINRHGVERGKHTCN